MRRRHEFEVITEEGDPIFISLCGEVLEVEGGEKEIGA